ncbi:MAG: alpha/beta hydrolase [Mycobacteriales bacterium]
MRITGVVAPTVAARMAERMFFTPPRPPLRPAERAVLDTAERFAVGVDTVAYAWGGAADPVVLLVHGWGGHAGHLAGFVEPLVAAGYRPIALDLPGHGTTPRGRTSLVHFARAVRAAADRTGPVHGVVAHSFGAAAVTFALARGLPVERAVFVSPSARFEGYWAWFRAAVGVSDRVWVRLRRHSEGWLGVSYDDIHPVGYLAEMTVPLLVVHSADDREVPLGEGKEIVAGWAGATLREVDGLGHLRILRDQNTQAEAVTFLTG